MPKSPLADDVLQRGFDLAYFIHGDKASALRIVTEAAEKLDVSMASQDKRLYYQPKVEHFRTKVSLSRLHLFQRLIYIVSEKHEKEWESRNRADQSAMVVRFIKHLVRITWKRNSFYVALGVSRLLHTYATAQTMWIYDRLQDSDRGRDDCYFRSRKSILMRELVDRFGDSLRVCRGPHGEERFQSVDCPSRYAPLVRRSLEMFTPWDTPCPVTALVPMRTDPLGSFVSSDSNSEDEVEIRRMHAILHPPCFEWLTRSLALPPPELRVDVPVFAMAADQHDGDGPTGERPSLNALDLREIRAQLAEKASFRKAMPTETLRIVLDGADRGRLDLREPANVRLEIDDTAEVIEILRGYGHSETPLALFLLPHEGNRLVSCQAMRTLECGERLLLTVRATESTASVDVSCHPAVITRLIRWLAERRKAALIASTATAVALFGWLAAFQHPHAAATKAIGSHSAPAASITRIPAPNPTAESEPGQVTESVAELEKTRGATVDARETALPTRPRIYIDVQGKDGETRALKEAVTGAIRSLPGARIASSEKASAALKLFIEDQSKADQLTVHAKLVDVAGTVLWPEDGSKKTYRGSATAIAAAVINDLRARFSAARR